MLSLLLWLKAQGSLPASPHSVSIHRWLVDKHKRASRIAAWVLTAAFIGFAIALFRQRTALD